MKKIFTMAAITLFMMASCTSETTPVNNPDNQMMLVKQMIVTDSYGTYTGEYTYEGNKITNITYSDNEYQNFTYNNDLLVKVETYEDGILSDSEIFEYDENNKLTTYLFLHYDMERGDKKIFTYNTDGTVSYEDFTGDLETQTQLNSTGNFTIDNNNITEHIQTFSLNSTTFTYTFDDKNSPSKNVFAGDIFNMVYAEGGNNNIISCETANENESYTVTYTYNDNGYPTESVETYNDGSSSTIQYFYE